MYKDLKLLSDQEKLKRMDAYIKLKDEYKNSHIFDENLIDLLIRSEMFNISKIISTIKTNGIEQYFLKEISTKSSIILTLLFALYDLSYLLYSYLEEKCLKQYYDNFTRL